MKNPYEILGVSKNASEKEIKQAYRDLAKKHHPDLNPGNKTAEAKFKEISGAYAQIGTAEARGKYDRGETAEQQQERAQEQARQYSYYNTQQGGGRYSQSYSQEFDDDFFASLFRGATGRSQRPSQGEDHMYQMEVDFKDAALGATREILLPTGKKLSVKIPAGIESGAKLRLKHQGGAGSGKAAAGDAYVEITVRPMAGFTRNGNNLQTELPISFQEAILGGEVMTATLDGKVKLKIPAGVSTGTQLRIRGKGVGAEGQRGDQIVALKIVLPEKIDPELQATIRSWGDKFSYDPRRPS
jgi:DnaJ-class molecular chaperone